MSVLNPVNGELFTVRIYKYNVNNVDRQWANTYELQAQVGPSYEELIAAGDKLVAMEKLLHGSNVAFSNMVISTFAPDGEPYDPTSFVAIAQTGVGSRTSTSETLPTGLVLYVSRNVLSGRMGRLFYRGALFEDDMTAPAGIPRFSDPEGMEIILQNAVTTPGVDDMFAAGPDPFYLVMAGAPGDVRDLTGFTAKGIRQVRVDHRFYDRAP